MGVEQFNQTVRGQGGTLRTNASGVIETDNYPEGGVISVGSADYPATINPAETIQELIITSTGGDIVADITTTSGTTLQDVALNGATLVLDHLEIDSVEFKDPQATGQKTEGLWVGE